MLFHEGGIAFAHDTGATRRPLHRLRAIAHAVTLERRTHGDFAAGRQTETLFCTAVCF